MNFIVKVMVILLILFPLIVLTSSCFFTKEYYKIQKAIFGKIIPKSPDDTAKLLLGGSLLLLSLWSILYVLISLIENVI